jgi:hypothetical protein
MRRVIMEESREHPVAAKWRRRITCNCRERGGRIAIGEKQAQKHVKTRIYLDAGK